MSEKKSFDELLQLTKQCPEVWSVWVHSKSGNKYIVAGSAIAEATQEPVVLYRAPTSPKSIHAILFTRPLYEWEELVEIEGKKVPRFVPFVDPKKKPVTNPLMEK